jgi:hypothetical protein
VCQALIYHGRQIRSPLPWSKGLGVLSIIKDIDSMELSALEKSRKRILAFLCLTICIPLEISYSIVDYLEGDTMEMATEIFLCMIFIAALVGIKKFNRDQPVYRFGLIILTLGLGYEVLIGSGKGTVVYWLFPLPMVYMFFLGKKEGGCVSVIFLILLSALLFNPFSFPIYSYDLGIGIRFLASLIFLTLISYGLEASREEYGRVLIEKHKNLLKEKLNLEKALMDNKTLSGLLPICSNCKKIRDDEGYWQQVEVYIRDHSEADFSHSICPDCIKVLYPEYKGLRR